jgi:hypothetical protein
LYRKNSSSDQASTAKQSIDKFIASLVAYEFIMVRYMGLKHQKQVMENCYRMSLTYNGGFLKNRESRITEVKK